jgi:hypothetical protein
MMGPEDYEEDEEELEEEDRDTKEYPYGWGRSVKYDVDQE